MYNGINNNFLSFPTSQKLWFVSKTCRTEYATMIWWTEIVPILYGIYYPMKHF